MEIGVDAVGVPGEQLQALRVQGVQLGLGGPAKADDAAVAVDLQSGLAEEFGHGAVGQAAVLLHLPHAVLGMGKALGAEEIRLALGVDVGHAVLVPQHLHGRVQDGQGQLAVDLGHGALDQPPIEVEKGQPAQGDQGHDDG